MDLSQAEAVNEIIAGSNQFQVSAAERLLEGRLANTIAEIRAQIIDCLSLLEAAMDFSEEDIEFITAQQATEKLSNLVERLHHLLDESIAGQSLIDLPSVGIAGAPNAGKSSLLNTLLEAERSIVSHEPKTTRDVLAGTLILPDFRCVLFDCAGLISFPQSAIDKLAQQAAIDALSKASAVLFCVDISKDDWQEDETIYRLAAPSGRKVIALATKSDLLSESLCQKRLSRLEDLFAIAFVPISVISGQGLTPLRKSIDARLAEVFGPSKGQAAQSIALTARHRQTVTDAIENLQEAIAEVKAANPEIAAMMLRAACKALGDIEHEPIDEKLLSHIFGRFCIGK
jgi:tRNA modification GTPase